MTSSVYVQVDNYDVDSFIMQHTMQTSDATQPLTSGEIYGFKWRCYNLMGYSDFSETFYAAASAQPDVPIVPRIVYTWSSNKTIFVEWD